MKRQEAITYSRECSTGVRCRGAGGRWRWRWRRGGCLMTRSVCLNRPKRRRLLHWLWLLRNSGFSLLLNLLWTELFSCCAPLNCPMLWWNKQWQSKSVCFVCYLSSQGTWFTSKRTPLALVRWIACRDIYSQWEKFREEINIISYCHLPELKWRQRGLAPALWLAGLETLQAACSRCSFSSLLSLAASLMLARNCLSLKSKQKIIFSLKTHKKRIFLNKQEPYSVTRTLHVRGHILTLRFAITNGWKTIVAQIWQDDGGCARRHVKDSMIDTPDVDSERPKNTPDKWEECLDCTRTGVAFFPSNHSSAVMAGNSPGVSGYKSSWNSSDCSENKNQVHVLSFLVQIGSLPNHKEI